MCVHTGGDAGGDDRQSGVRGEERRGEEIGSGLHMGVTWDVGCIPSITHTPKHASAYTRTYLGH